MLSYVNAMDTAIVIIAGRTFWIDRLDADYLPLESFFWRAKASRDDAPIACSLDRVAFETVAAQLKARSITIKPKRLQWRRCP